jgi:hypothetical protein
LSAPSTTVNKLAASQAQGAPGQLGVLAIIASCSGAALIPPNVATVFSDTGIATTDLVEGRLLELVTYAITVTENQVVAVLPTTTTSGSVSVGAVTPATILAVASVGPPAELTTSATHGFATGYIVTIAGATGDTAINGTYPVTVVDSTHFTIPVTGSGSYTASSATATWTGATLNSSTGGASAGTAVPTISASAAVDSYLVELVCTNGGTFGTTGITFSPSLDFGQSFGPTIALGTALSTTLVVPVTGASTGVTVNFTTAQTINTGDVITAVVSGPAMQSGDLTSAFAALKASAFQYEAVLIDDLTGGITPTFVAQIDAWVQSLALLGQYPHVYVNTRLHYASPVELDATYQTAMSTLLASAASNNMIVGTDGGDCVSSVSGVVKRQHASLGIACKVMEGPIGQDPAFVQGAGAITNFNITGPNGLPKYHDEFREGGLDSTVIRLSTLRTWPSTVGAGTFVTNAYVLQSAGFGLFYVQQLRVLNVGAGQVYVAMSILMSAGYERNTKTGLILEAQAAEWEERGQAVLNAALNGQVSGAVFTVSRIDINLGNGPASITCWVRVAYLGYVKRFLISEYAVQTLA